MLQVFWPSDKGGEPNPHRPNRDRGFGPFAGPVHAFSWLTKAIAAGNDRDARLALEALERFGYAVTPPDPQTWRAAQ